MQEEQGMGEHGTRQGKAGHCPSSHGSPDQGELRGRSSPPDKPGTVPVGLTLPSAASPGGSGRAEHRRFAGLGGTRRGAQLPPPQSGSLGVALLGLTCLCEGGYPGPAAGGGPITLPIAKVAPRS